MDDGAPSPAGESSFRGDTPDITTAYVYDSGGLRVEGTGTGGTTRYIYSTSGVLLESRSPNLTRTFTNLGTSILGWTDTTSATSGIVSTRYYAVTDQLGSVTAVMDTGGTILGTSDYTPFGGGPGAYLKELLEKLPTVRLSGDWDSLLQVQWIFFIATGGVILGRRFSSSGG